MNGETNRFRGKEVPANQTHYGEHEHEPKVEVPPQPRIFRNESSDHGSYNYTMGVGGAEDKIAFNQHGKFD